MTNAEEPRLVPPDVIFERSFREMLVELGPNPPRAEAGLFGSFEAYTRRLRALSVKPPDGVRRDILWLVQGDELLGRVTVIHTLTDRLRDQGGNINYLIRPSARGKGYGKRILLLALEHARTIGLTEALVTVLSDNPASERVVQTAGGTLQSVSDLGGGCERRRYVVRL